MSLIGKKQVDCKMCGESFVSYNPNPQFCTNRCRGDSLKHHISVEKMIDLYESGMTQEEVAKELGTTQKVVWKRMKEIGYEARVAFKRNQYGESNDSWQGGRTIQSNGYVYIKSVGHPKALVQGDYVLEHRLAVEEVIGRYLEEGEVVHHINGKKDDNHPENLYITNPSEHVRMHNDNVSHLLTSNLEEYRKAENG